MNKIESSKLTRACLIISLLSTFTCGRPSVSPNEETVALDKLIEERQASFNVINGAFTSFANYPFYIAFGKNDTQCSGSIIHVTGQEVVVLTAAHCVGNEALEIFASAHNELIGKQSSKILVHPQYDPRSLDYDFALVFFDSDLIASSVELVFDDELNLNANLDPLPPELDIPQYSEEKKVLIAGMGSTQQPCSGNDPGSDIKHGAMKLLTNEECQVSWGNDVTTSMICTEKADGSDIQGGYGDSGGPLLSIGENGFRQHGVYSWGDSRCDSSPNVYGRISAVAVWIQSQANLGETKNTPPATESNLSAPYNFKVEIKE